MKAKIAWLVVDKENKYPYLVYKEPNKYTYPVKTYTSIQKIVYFEVEDEDTRHVIKPV